MKLIQCPSCAPIRKNCDLKQWASEWVINTISNQLHQTDHNNQILKDIRINYYQYSVVKSKMIFTCPKKFGQILCWSRCYPIFWGVGKTKVLALKGMVEENVQAWVHQGTENVRYCFHRDHVVTYIIGLQRMYGEKQPDGNKYELPPDSKQEYYVNYVVSQVIHLLTMLFISV